MDRSAATVSFRCIVTRSTVAVALLLGLIFPGCSPDRSALPEEFLLGGIQVNEPDMHAWHARLLGSDFNTIALTVYARQHRWDGPEITFDPDQLGGDLVREMRAAKRAGLRVVLILRVALDHGEPQNRFLWHGLIQPLDDSDLDAWFFRYGEFVRRWAEVAQSEGVDVFGIGSELSSLTSTQPLEELPGLERYYLDQETQEEERLRALRARGGDVPRAALEAGWNDALQDLGTFLDERIRAQADWARGVTFDGNVERINRRRERLDANWRRVIQEVRGVYSGALTYAANFDQYAQVGFWDALDAIGVNAYFPLRGTLDSSRVEQLEPTFVESWRRILGGIDEVRAEQKPGAPVIFTELGYTRWRGSTIQPWAGDGFAVLEDENGEQRRIVWREQPLEVQERALAIKTLARVAAERDGLLRGLLYWKLSSVPDHRNIEPFVIVLEDEADPALAALRTFRSRP